MLSIFDTICPWLSARMFFEGKSTDEHAKALTGWTYKTAKRKAKSESLR